MSMCVESKNTRFLHVDKLSDVVGYHTPEHYRLRKTTLFVFALGCCEGALIAFLAIGLSNVI